MPDFIHDRRAGVLRTTLSSAYVGVPCDFLWTPGESRVSHIRQGRHAGINMVKVEHVRQVRNVVGRVARR